jgi:hypothetical protein
VIGCAGLINAARAGNVTIANAVGNGVADDKLVYTYIPDLIRYYLSEEPLLDNVESYRLDQPDVLDWVLGHLGQLVVKPVDGAGGAGIVIGPRATPAELGAVRERLRADPRGWMAQRPVALSTSPVLIGETPAPRHIDLRPFAYNAGDDVWLLPGGLTRVALPEGELVVNSSQGGGSKDTWVLASPRSTGREAVTEEPAPTLPLMTAGPEPPVPSWPELRAESAPGRLLEFLLPTPLTTVTPDAATAVLDAVGDADPARTAEEIAARVRSQLRYMAGATGVRTNAQEAWDQGQGVCQDMAHVTVALLRAAGLPARYVSGYLHADPSAEPGQTAVGESHAWVEYWAGSWCPLDPTSGAPVRERHVVVARGRDYADVSPLKGIYHGAPASPQEVTVEVTRLA